MSQDPDKFLTPEQIWNDFTLRKVKNSNAVYLLKTILENSQKISIRLRAIEIIGKINLKNEETFKILESCLLSDENHLVRTFSAFLIYLFFPNRRDNPLKWVARKDKSSLVRQISLRLTEKARREIEGFQFISWEDFKVKYLPDYYGVVPDEIGFIVDLEIFLGDQFPRDYKYSLRNLQKLDYASPLFDENENRWLINHWFGDIMGFTYVVENKRIVGLNLPVLGDVILEMFSKSIAKLSNLQYLTLNLLKSVPKSLTSIRSLKGLRLRTTTKCKKLLLPDDIVDLKSLKVIELSRYFFKSVSEPLLSLIRQNIAPQYIQQGVHPDDAVSLGLLDAYLERDIERDYGYQENRFDINEQGRVVSIKLLEDQGYYPFMSIPEPIYNFRFLERLTIVHIHFSYISFKIKKLNRLRELDLHNNQLKTVPRFISKLRNLEKLILRGTKIEKFPEVLTSLTLLKYLDLSETKIKTIPDSISSLKNLEYLGLPQNMDYVPPSIITINLKYWKKKEDERQKNLKKRAKK